MLNKVTLENGMVRVSFHVSHEIWADSIALVGDFNDWNTGIQFLCQSRDDEDWHCSLELEAGRSYRFRYLVNSQEWMDDDQADAYEPNTYGGFDSVVRT